MLPTSSIWDFLCYTARSVTTLGGHRPGNHILHLFFGQVFFKDCIMGMSDRTNIHEDWPHQPFLHCFLGINRTRWDISAQYVLCMHYLSIPHGKWAWGQTGAISYSAVLWMHWQVHFVPARKRPWSDYSYSSRKLGKHRLDCTTQRSLFGTAGITRVTYAELDQTAHNVQSIICRFPFQSRAH